MRHVLLLVVWGDLLDHGIFCQINISCHTYEHMYKYFCVFEFQIVLDLMENPKKWEQCLTVYPCTHTLIKRESCVWHDCFLLTSLVTRGQVAATPVSVTWIPWASSVSQWNAHLQHRSQPAALLAISWSTKQTDAAQHKHAVSQSFREQYLNLSHCSYYNSAPVSVTKIKLLFMGLSFSTILI